MIKQSELLIETQGRGTQEITVQINALVSSSGIITGLCHVFILHTSASLMLCENADPDVLRDMETFISALVPDGDRRFSHRAEGPDDMPAHVRSVLTHSDIILPISHGQCRLGTWQGLYLWEHRHQPHQRRLVVTLQGE